MDKIVTKYVNLWGSTRTSVRKALEHDQEAPGEQRAAVALGDEWTRDLVALAMDEMPPVGMGCRLRDSIRDTDKAENERDTRREERDQQANGGGQQGDANLPEDVFLVVGKHTCAGPALAQGST